MNKLARQGCHDMICFFYYLACFLKCHLLTINKKGWHLMDSKQFNNSIEKGIFLVDFNAQWCAPCKIQEPIIHAVQKKFKDKVSVIFINIDENNKLATDFMVQSIPTLIIYNNGVEVERFIGLQTEETIEKKLNSII